MSCMLASLVPRLPADGLNGPFQAYPSVVMRLADSMVCLSLLWPSAFRISSSQYGIRNASPGLRNQASSTREYQPHGFIHLQAVGHTMFTMANSKSIVLITGANGRLGPVFVSQFLKSPQSQRTTASSQISVSIICLTSYLYSCSCRA